LKQSIYKESPKYNKKRYKKYYKCSTVIGGKLNSYDSILHHWNARYLLGDIMSKIAYTEEEVISEFTLAYLADSKFYKVKYY